jgi:GT2 family glycosyltransferase
MLSGAALFFPKSLFETIGGLDPQLFWMEDADFSLRASQAGAKLVYFPSSVIVHHSGQSSKKNQKVVVSNQLLSKLKYYRKHLSWIAFAAGVFFCFIHICSRILIFSGLSLFASRYREKAAAYYFTFGKFFRYLLTSDKSVT